MTAMENKCIFCDKSEYRRAIAENGEFFVKATYGMMNVEGYVLLVPKGHVSCYGAMPAKQYKKFGKARDALIDAVEKNYGNSVVVFEHGITGQTVGHAHLHGIPGIDFNEMVAETEKLVASDEEKEYRHVPFMKEVKFGSEDERKELSRAAKMGGYLYIGERSSGRAVVIYAKPEERLKMVLRKAAARVLGNEELFDWRKSRSTPELAAEDEALRERTVGTLKKEALLS